MVQRNGDEQHDRPRSAQEVPEFLTRPRTSASAGGADPSATGAGRAVGRQATDGAGRTSTSHPGAGVGTGMGTGTSRTTGTFPRQGTGRMPRQASPSAAPHPRRAPAAPHGGASASSSGHTAPGSGGTAPGRGPAAPRPVRRAVHHEPGEAYIRRVEMPHGSVADRRAGEFRHTAAPRDFKTRTPLAAIVAAALAVVLVAGGCLWYFALREVETTINGQQETVRVNSLLRDVLQDNDYFGVTPGNLLSITGNVIDADGGGNVIVTRDGTELTAEELDQARVGGGETFTVADGPDETEASHEETVDAMPQVQMERGGAVQYVSQWGKRGKKIVTVGDTSGETVDKEVVEPATDMVVSSINLSPQGESCVALTFDDGPSAYTADILAILKEKGAVATFFNLGTSVASRPEDAKAVVEAGMELASHTNTHENLPDLDRESLRSEISSAFDTIETATGERPRMIRAPYGAFTAAEWGRAGDLISCNVLWNIDTLDWKRPGAQAITNAVLNNVRNGSIVLMHDGGGDRSQDIEALPGIIDGLRERGYKLVTVSELMERDGRVPEDVIAGTVSAPDGVDMPE